MRRRVQDWTQLRLIQVNLIKKTLGDFFLYQVYLSYYEIVFYNASTSLCLLYGRNFASERPLLSSFEV